ncbi:MAG TPA: hypothetical protein VK541_25280 [Pedobacter sp.]|uniref:hypothetical protein n=1 Tax=Pedobacter sp. TaxID=1411316 RepID=UPI002BD4EEAF|nr:hypothetical protein [Pedobacter sp.]HMI05824.1 hypothetical protein [Pedobacter sp.]
MKGYISLVLLLILFSGCKRQVKIDNHFLLSSFDTNDLCLIYLDDNNLMFSVIKEDVIAYLKCSNHIYIIQHPLDTMGQPDGHDPQYFVIDTAVDYSDEKMKPYSISQSRFEEMLKNECQGKS